MPGVVLSSRGVAAALEVLAHADTAFSGREVQRLSGVGTHPTTTAALERLVAHGLVHREVKGRSHLYRLNRDHLAAPAAIALATLYESFLSLLRRELGAWEVPAVHASLFGSVARRSGGPGSDVDLLIVRPDGLDVEDELWWGQVDELERAVFRATGNTLARFELTASELHAAVRAGEPIVADWLTDSITVAGPDLASVVRAAG